MCNANHDWVAISSLIVAIASLIAAGTAALYARNALLQAKLDAERSLAQAKIVAERDEDDWAQRQWFELYSVADEAYDAIDKFQASYPRVIQGFTPELIREWNDLMVTLRAAGRRCHVFPKHPAIDKFLSAIAFSDRKMLVPPSYLKGVEVAVEGLRELAGINPGVLKRQKMNFE